jgi:hypothetical protein
MKYLVRAKRPLMFGSAIALGQAIGGLIFHGWTRDAVNRVPEVFLLSVAVAFLLDFGKSSK